MIRRAKRHSGLTAVLLNAERLAASLQELMPIGDGVAPVQVLARRNAAGRFVRLDADYANGWRLTVRLNSRREVTSFSASVRLQSEPKGDGV